MTEEVKKQKLFLEISIVFHMDKSQDIPKKIQVLDEDFNLIDSRWIKGNGTSFELTPGIYVVKLVLSSGKEQEKAIEVKEGGKNKLNFNIGTFSPRETQEWVYLNKSNSGRNPQSLLREKFWDTFFGGITGYLWTYNSETNSWQKQPVPELTGVTIDAVGLSFELNTYSDQLHFLQVEGSSIQPLFVSLPPGHQIQCLVKLAAGPEKVVHPLDITVATQNTTAETLLSLITAGRMDNAKTFFSQAEWAEELLYGKMLDPVSAAIGGYFLLKVGELEKMHDWPNNLAEWMPWLPDGAIIHAWQMIRSGNEKMETIDKIRARLVAAAERGIPVYTEGLKLLYEGLNLLWYQFGREDIKVENALRKIKRYMEFADMSQETVTFTGESPEQPGFNTSNLKQGGNIQVDNRITGALVGA